jgi:YfiH family protein
MLSLPSEPVWLEQIHSNRVINAAFPAAIQKADASYSCVPNIVCTVMTADCLPLLVCAVDGSQVAAIHAGWRGLLSGIISNTLAFFHQQDVLVWLGPAICCECFEVGTDVYDAFLKKSSAFDKAFKNRGNGKYLADIYLLARLELESLNINKIYCARFCTVCEPNLFYSYRRENITGRMATLIWRG